MEIKDATDLSGDVRQLMQQIRHTPIFEQGFAVYADVPDTLKIFDALDQLPLHKFEISLLEWLKTELSELYAPIRKDDEKVLKSIASAIPDDPIAAAIAEKLRRFKSRLEPILISHEIAAWQLNEVNATAKELKKVASGDVAEISQIKETLKAELPKIEELKNSVLDSAKEAAEIETATTQFKFYYQEAAENLRESKNWGIGALTFLILAIGWAGVVVWLTWNNASTSGGLDAVISRFGLLFLLLGGAAWCGRVFTILRHQVRQDRQRKLSIQTLLVLSLKEDDRAIKEALMNRATEAVFSPGHTGFGDFRANTHPGARHVIEIAKELTGIPK